jgi:quaternary ammonium compound-resistance protein SugE
MGWIYLVLAGIFEIGFTTSLKLSDNFSKLWPSVSFLVLSILSFYFLTRAIQTIPLGTGYAVWTGIGALGTVVVGIVFFMEPVTAARIFFLLMLIFSIIGLKLVSN